MKTIKQNVTAQIEQKKSKFICDLFYVSSQQEVEEKIKEIKKKYYDAKHHCYAYRINNKNMIIEKSSDDGEPSGTAGNPMLNLLSKNKLVNVLAIVTRYFGGILLGTGGLVRAYTQCTQNAIENANFVNEELGLELKVILSYQNFEILKTYCQINKINILNVEFSEMVSLIMELTFNEKDKIMYEIDKNNLNIQNIEIVKEKVIRKM